MKYFLKYIISIIAVLGIAGSYVAPTATDQKPTTVETQPIDPNYSIHTDSVDPEYLIKPETLLAVPELDNTPPMLAARTINIATDKDSLSVNFSLKSGTKVSICIGSVISIISTWLPSIINLITSLRAKKE